MMRKGADMLHVRQIMKAAEAAQKPKKARAASPPVRQADTVAPTPERIAQAAGAYEISATGIMRVNPAPLDRLRAHRHLNRDPDLNALLWTAGDRYRSDWYLSGLSGSAGVTLEQSGGGGPSHPAYMMPNSERAASFRAMWRQAYRAIEDGNTRQVVNLIVLEEAPVVNVGRIVTMEVGRDRCREAALDLLREGLRILAKHYGLGG